jgi:hypothetical protein
MQEPIRCLLSKNKGYTDPEASVAMDLAVMEQDTQIQVNILH